MLESIRRHQKIMMIVLIILIVPAFVVVGAWDLISPGGGANTVAKVGKQNIQYVQWERAHQEAVRQVQAQFGGRVDLALIDTDISRRSTLEDLVTEQLLLASTREFRVFASDQKVRSTIASIPAAQRNGAFNMEAYQQALKAQGMTAESFEAQVRAELSIEAIPAALASSAFAPRSVGRRLAQLSQESRAVRVKRFPASDFMGSVQVSEQQAQEFYQSNLARFQVPEEVDIQVIAFAKPGSADQVEKFANLVYEQAESLEPASKALGLPIQTLKQVRKTGPVQDVPASLRPVLLNPRFLQSLFTVDAIKNKRNTESVEISPGVLASARVIAHRAAAPIAFDSVKSQIMSQLRSQQAAEKARQAAQNAAELIEQAAEATSGLGPARLMSRSQQKKHSDETSPELVRAVFAANLAKLPFAVVATSADGSAWLAMIESAQVPESDSSAVRQALGAEFAKLEQASLADTLDRWIALQREKIGVKIYTEKIAKSADR